MAFCIGAAGHHIEGMAKEHPHADNACRMAAMLPSATSANRVNNMPPTSRGV
jgi:hypothetical protein